MADAVKKTEWSRQTVNFTPDLADKAEKRWRALGFVSWTEYITWLVSGDLRERPMAIRTEDGVVFATHFTNTPQQHTATKTSVRRNRSQMPSVITEQENPNQSEEAV
jgi:hypothetical protein